MSLFIFSFVIYCKHILRTDIIQVVLCLHLFLFFVFVAVQLFYFVCMCVFFSVYLCDRVHHGHLWTFRGTQNRSRLSAYQICFNLSYIFATYKHIVKRVIPLKYMVSDILYYNLNCVNGKPILSSWKLRELNVYKERINKKMLFRNKRVFQEWEYKNK